MAAQDEKSRHAAITATLRDEIRSGQLPPGSAVASEAELSERFGVARGTVRQALASLRSEGLISGGRGRRPVVARPALAQSFDELISFTAWAEGLGRTPQARTLELARRPVGSDDGAVLGLPTGANVYQYKRLRLLDGQPMMIELSTFIEPVGKLLLDCDLDTGSVYAQLGDRGVEFAEATHTIASVAASSEQAQLLQLPRRSPLLEVTRLVLDPGGRAIELSRDSYRGDAFEITLHNAVALRRAGVGLSLVK